MRKNPGMPHHEPYMAHVAALSTSKPSPSEERMNRKVLAAIAVVLAVPAACASETPYAGEQQRRIKALSDQEVAALMAGAGLGYAKAAELNSHPGPMHALELADRLELTAQQRQALADLMSRHRAEARSLGAELVRLEADLDRMFAERTADADAVQDKTAEIASVQARLRASHLVTHIAATALLTPWQVARYDELRGYGRGGSPGGHQRHH
jgi:Spy/CpxP family protein refolding chaperone